MAWPGPDAQRGPRQLLTREGPTDQEVTIIGVELAVTPVSQDGSQRREVELQMFACSHTLPVPHPYGPGEENQVRVTLHTSKGDITLRGELLR